MSQPSTLVSELVLHLRLPAQLQAERDAARAQAEGPWIKALLTELDARLHAALGASAIVHIRHLALKCSVPFDELDSPAVAIAVAIDTAEHLLAELNASSHSARLRPSSDEMVCFEDRAHRDAACWADRADDVTRWFHDPEQRSFDVIGTAVLRSGTDHLTQVLEWLVRMRCAERACAGLNIEQLLTALADVPESALEARQVLTQSLQQRGFEAALQSVGCSRPVRTSRNEQTTRDAGEATPVADAAYEPSSVAAVQVPDQANSKRRDVPTTVTSADAATMPGDARDALSVSGARLSEAAVKDASIPAASDNPAALIAEHSAATKYGGLFYLVNTTLQLDLAEALWAAGLSEAAFLAHVMLSITRDETDVSWRWFAVGDDPKPLPVPEVPTWAMNELHERVLHGLGRKLARAGVVTTPQALEGLLTSLRTQVPPIARANEVTAKLVEHCAAALACAIAAELKRPMSWDPIVEMVRRDALLVCTRDVLWVGMSASAIDLSLRKAGLDRDCPWAPWLARAVRFEFRGLEEL